MLYSSGMDACLTFGVLGLVMQEAGGGGERYHLAVPKRLWHAAHRCVVLRCYSLRSKCFTCLAVCTAATGQHGSDAAVILDVCGSLLHLWSVLCGYSPETGRRG